MKPTHRCPSCSHLQQVPKQWLGKPIRCAKCRGEFRADEGSSIACEKAAVEAEKSHREKVEKPAVQETPGGRRETSQDTGLKWILVGGLSLYAYYILETTAFLVAGCVLILLGIGLLLPPKEK